MSCSDLLPIQKVVNNKRNCEPNYSLNPYGELLFSNDWKWTQNQQISSKLKQTNTIPTSLKNDILLW